MLMNVGAMSMNPGGIIGVFLGIGITIWIAGNPESGKGLFFGGVIVGAIGGNYLWRLVFPKKE